MSSFWQTVAGAIVGGVLSIGASVATTWWLLRENRQQAREARLLSGIDETSRAAGRLAHAFTSSSTQPSNVEELFRQWETEHFVLLTRMERGLDRAAKVLSELLASARRAQTATPPDVATGYFDCLAYMAALAYLARDDKDLREGRLDVTQLRNTLKN